MKKRSIGMMILLCLVTFGIYPIYWQCSFQNQLKENTGEGFNGIVHFFMCIFTFGIYNLYWQYAASKRLEKLGGKDNAVLYLVIALVGFGFINMFLLQNDANQLQKK